MGQKMKEHPTNVHNVISIPYQFHSSGLGVWESLKNRKNLALEMVIHIPSPHEGQCDFCL